LADPVYFLHKPFTFFIIGEDRFTYSPVLFQFVKPDFHCGTPRVRADIRAPSEDEETKERVLRQFYYMLCRGAHNPFFIEE